MSEWGKGWPDKPNLSWPDKEKFEAIRNPTVKEVGEWMADDAIRHGDGVVINETAQITPEAWNSLKKWTLQEGVNKAIEGLNKAKVEGGYFYGMDLASDPSITGFHFIIPLEDGTVRYITDGIVIGDLAVYKGLGWQIIHLPTMTKFDKAVPPGLHTKRALIGWCVLVQNSLSDDWTKLRTLTPENYKTIDDETDEVTDEEMQDVKDRIREWCLSVKVEE